MFSNVFNAIAGICGTFQELLLNHLQSICRSTIGEACLCIFSSQYHYQTAPIVSFFSFQKHKDVFTNVFNAIAGIVASALEGVAFVFLFESHFLQ